MTIGRLLVLALLVAPLASCAASLIAGGATLASLPRAEDFGTYIIGILFFAFFATIVSLLLVFAALALLAVPLTLLLQKLRAPTLLRDLALLGFALLIGLLFLGLAIGGDDGIAWIMVAYALTTAGLWVAALHIDARRRRRASGEAVHARFQ